MDKYEYKIRIDEIDSLINEKKYREAVEVADTIDWRNVRNSKTLCTISDLYKKCKRYEDSRDVLLLAYQRNPGGRMILYSLCELSIKIGDIVNAIEYLKEYAQAAPKDPGRFVLKYKLYTAEEVGLDERIQVLEELQQYECRERWMYELAYLYHMQGYSDKCVEECDQLIIYFGDGKYVIKALELKANHQPLSAQQDALYRRLTSPVDNEILVKDMDVSKFNTIDLQKELASSMAEVFFNDSPKKAEEPKPAEPEPVVEDTTVINNGFSFEETFYQEPEIQKPSNEEEVSQETQMYNAKEVESALQNEPSVSRTVLPKSGRFDEMHEVMPQTSKNPAIVFPNYDDMVSMEGDGQISFNIPEQEMIEKQITGQISIEDVLAEWERLRIANEKAWSDNMRRKVIKQTSGIFKEFDESSKTGLLEQLENESTDNSSVEYTEEEILVDETGEEIIMVSEPETEPEPEQEPVTEEPQPEPVENTQDIREIFFEEETEVETEKVPEEEPSVEELSFDRTPYINEESEKEEESIDESDTKVLPGSEAIDNYLMAFAEASEERDLADQAIMATAMTSVNVVEELLEDIPEEVSEASEEIPEVQEEIMEISEEEPEVPEEELGFPKEEPEEVSEEEAELPEETEDFERYDESEVEQAESFEEEASDESDETELPEEPEEAENFEEPEESEEEKKDDYDVKEEPCEPVIRPSGFTEEQEGRFEAFIQTEISREALKLVIERISMESNTGNAIVGSEDVDSGIEFAKALIMEISSREEISGKVAKIKASTLNAKDAQETLSKLYDGALIIQDANELRPETLDAVRKVVEVEDKKLFIVLTVSRRAKHRFIMDNSDMLSSFNVSYDIEALNNKELVEYAKAYAYSKDYTIDEVGMLALHTRIEDKQTNEHSVTVCEVRDIVDQAISKAGKKNAKHFIDVLVGKRYDEDDRVVLREKDFTE